MNYYQYKFTVQPIEPGTDILISCLGDFGFESFENTDEGFNAYLPEVFFSELKLDDLKFNDFKFHFTIEKIQQINWNKEWESNFHPVIVNDECCIRAPFHQLEKKYKYDLIIMPKMSFGTGHHETTWLVSKNMFEFEFRNKTVFDMGCGTGILAILASKLGASFIVANDIDPWSIENSRENFEVNACPHIKIYAASETDLLTGNNYDIILANINKNVLKAHISKFKSALNKEGLLFISGFFKTDCDELILLAEVYKLQLIKKEYKNEWAVLIFKNVTE